MFSRLFLICVLAFSLQCATVKPTGDQFLNAIVDCSVVNPESSAAGSAVLSCLQNAVAGNPAACLFGLVEVGHWTVDEIACLVRSFGAQSNAKALATGGSEAARIAQAARNFIQDKRIGYR